MIGIKYTNLPFPLYKRGKVRDIYDFNDKILIVTTDRISAFDIVFEDIIPEKGEILTQISCFWFKILSDIVENHIITSEISKYPKECFPYKDILEKRSVLTKKVKMIPMECIVRGYLTGSAWEDYKNSGKVFGIKFNKKLKENEKFPEPIFIPATKAEAGAHDINITFSELENTLGRELAHKLKDLSIKLYKKAYEFAYKKDLILVDTKFEFGIINNKIILADEILTPDSSRYWLKEDFKKEKFIPYDKQFFRNFLKSINWKSKFPPPKIPENIKKELIRRYKEVLTRIIK